jgi:hypothetical protein
LYLKEASDGILDNGFKERPANANSTDACQQYWVSRIVRNSLNGLAVGLRHGIIPDMARNNLVERNRRARELVQLRRFLQYAA